MNDDLYLPTPPGIEFRVEPGWSGMGDPSNAPTWETVQRVRVRNVDLPRFFTMRVTFNRPEWTWVAVFFEIDATLSPVAVSAWAHGTDVASALAELTELESLSWWTSKSLMALALGPSDGDMSDDQLHDAWNRVRMASTIPTSRRRTRITDALLSEVAEVYRANVSAGNPTEAVAKHFYVSRAQAARYVEKARAATYLKPAKGTTAGEAS